MLEPGGNRKTFGGYTTRKRTGTHARSTVSSPPLIIRCFFRFFPRVTGIRFHHPYGTHRSCCCFSSFSFLFEVKAIIAVSGTRTFLKYRPKYEESTSTPIIMSGSKRKNNSSSDFKRLKAKVGKKAQRQHDTDVSFQSASLHLGQSIQRDDEPKKSGNLQLLVSSRGKFLYQLVSTASTHPAAAARASSLKGILDIVKKYPTHALLPNLSTLIPVCVHSCVDEDQDVRSVAIGAFSSLLQRLQEKKIKPFGSLLLARISSALHSLDASIRVNGVKMVKVLSTTCPSLTASFGDKLLPPFSGLISDERTMNAIDEILQSLISVLRVHATRRTAISVNSPTLHHTSFSHGDSNVEISKKNDQQPDLFYVSGGRSRNTILPTKRSVHVLPTAIESILHLSHLERATLSSFNLHQTIGNSSRQRGSCGESFDTKSKTILMSKLRDCLIESINLENEPTMASTKTSSNKSRSSTAEDQVSTNYPRVILLLRSIRLLSKRVETDSGGTSNEDEIQFNKVTQQLLSVLIDVFPVDQDPSTISFVKDKNSANINDVNAEIALSILDVSQNAHIDNGTIENNNTKNWMKTICSHVIPRIGHLTDVSLTSSSDLDMTCKLLRRLGEDSAFSDDLDFISGLIQDLFFCDKDKEVARSIACRRISMIFVDLIDSTSYSLTDELKSPSSKAFSQFVKMIPFYLEAWAADFLYESRRLLEGLHRLIRMVQGSSDIALVESIRDNWYKLVANRGDSKSIFEMYPWNLQKIYLGLIVLVEKPSDQSLKYLATICCRSTLANDAIFKNQVISQAIIEAIRNVRRSIPMQRYLAFLFQSVGISRHVKEVQRLETISKSVFEEAFFRADSALNRVARALVETGSMKVLRMILPQLVSWQQTKVGDGVSSTEFLLKMRASHIILAYFFLQKHSKQENKLDDKPSIFDLIEGDISGDTVTHSICVFIHRIACNKEAMKFHSTLTSPTVAMISSDDRLFNVVLRKVCDLFCKPGLSKTEQENLKSILVDWMNDPRLEDSMTALSPSSNEMIEQLLMNSQDIA